jgi:hypothetical protein
MKMNSWPTEALREIVNADDLHIAPFRADGSTTGTPTWIWCVEVDGDLYVRGYNGQRSSWYQSAVEQRAGKIVAAGMTLDVAFEPVEGPITNRIDIAYQAKYSRSPYLKPMTSERARSATVKILPRNVG